MCGHWRLWLLLPLALVGCAGPATHEAYATDDCVVSRYPPTTPMGLDFCNWYNDEACCLPAMDLEVTDYFGHLMDLGPACAPNLEEVRARYARLREWVCLACDPKEPQYREWDPTSKRWRWRVCRSFVDRMWGTGGHQYDGCGILLQNPCDGGEQVAWNSQTGGWEAATVDGEKVPVLDGWDPFMCGDDLIVPSKEYADGEQFLRAIRVPGLADLGFTFRVVNDTLASNETCFAGAPQSTSIRLGTSHALRALCPRVLMGFAAAFALTRGIV